VINMQREFGCEERNKPKKKVLRFMNIVIQGSSTQLEAEMNRLVTTSSS